MNLNSPVSVAARPTIPIRQLGNGIGDHETKPPRSRTDARFAVPSALLWDSPGIQLKNLQALRLLAVHLAIDRDRDGNAGILPG